MCPFLVLHGFQAVLVLQCLSEALENRPVHYGPFHQCFFPSASWFSLSLCCWEGTSRSLQSSFHSEQDHFQHRSVTLAVFLSTEDACPTLSDLKNPRSQWEEGLEGQENSSGCCSAVALWDVPAIKTVEHLHWPGGEVPCAQGGDRHPSKKPTETCRGASCDSRACG